MLNQLSDQRIEQLAELLTVLAHPVRMQIVVGLTKPTSVISLWQRLQISQIELSHHLTLMQDSGLLNSEHQNGEMYYSLTDMALNRAIKLLLAKQTSPNMILEA